MWPELIPKINSVYNGFQGCTWNYAVFTLAWGRFFRRKVSKLHFGNCTVSMLTKIFLAARNDLAFIVSKLPFRNYTVSKLTKIFFFCREKRPSFLQFPMRNSGTRCLNNRPRHKCEPGQLLKRQWRKKNSPALWAICEKRGRPDSLKPFSYKMKHCPHWQELLHTRNWKIAPFNWHLSYPITWLPWETNSQTFLVSKKHWICP
jgi:hypothetical protein